MGGSCATCARGSVGSRTVTLGSALCARTSAAAPADVREMLANDIREEQADVKNYTRLASLAEQEGLFALKMKMEEQAADEYDHRQGMQRLLG